MPCENYIDRRMYVWPDSGSCSYNDFVNYSYMDIVENTNDC
jgi:hypothetical protein